jgi:hypothetical protein
MPNHGMVWIAKDVVTETTFEKKKKKCNTTTVSSSIVVTCTFEKLLLPVIRESIAKPLTATLNQGLRF